MILPPLCMDEWLQARADYPPRVGLFIPSQWEIYYKNNTDARLALLAMVRASAKK